MESSIEKAINLRNEECFNESIEILKKLVDDLSYSGKANLHIAWNYDAQGNEREAIPYYKKALNGKLNQVEKFDCLLGLASSLRCLGEYKEANTYFESTIDEFPEKLEILPFHAMNLYNLGKSKEAVSVLLNLLLKTTRSEDIKAYQQAIEIYLTNLDKTW